jgi:homoserine O-acetyltransferase
MNDWIINYRELATLTYRSGPEWEERFGRKRISENSEPSLCPHFMIENYLDYQGEMASTKLDPNTLIYISKVCRILSF